MSVFEFDIDRKELSSALKFISASISDSAARVLSVSGCVKFTKVGDVLCVQATDGLTNVSIDLPCSGSLDGSIVVNVGKLRSTIDTFSSDKIAFQLDGSSDVVHVYSGSADLSLQTVPVDTFPKVDKPSGTHDTKFDALSFNGCVRSLQSIPPEGDTNSRFYINGIFIKNVEGRVDVVATDGKRIGYCRAPESASSVASSPVLVPVRLMKAVASIDKSFVGIFSSVGDSDHVGICADGKYYITTPKNAVDGTSFPDYPKFLKKAESAESVFKVASAGLLELVNRANIVADGDYSIEISINNRSVSVSAGSGSSKIVEDMSVSEATGCEDGKSYQIFIHGASAKQAVSSLERVCESITIKVISSTAPIFFSDDLGNNVFIVAPVIR